MQNTVYRNWARTFSCSPFKYVEVSSEDDILCCINEAREKGLKLKVVGYGHSPSDLTMTNGFLINMKKLSRFTDFSKLEDTEYAYATFQAGATLSDILQSLAPFGYTLEQMPTIVDNTLAGVTAVSSHGTGISIPALSNFVVSFHFITAEGKRLACNSENHPDMYKAMQCHLGALGIITEITVKCKRQFLLKHDIFPLPFNEVLEQLDHYLYSNKHFLFQWYPYTDYVAVWTYNECAKTATLTPGKFSWIYEYLVGNFLVEFLYGIAALFGYVSFFEKILFWGFFGKRQSITAQSKDILTRPILLKQYVTDWAIPLDKARLFLRNLRKYILESCPDQVHAPIEVRFAPSDDIWLSPCYKQDTCYVNIISYRPFGFDVKHSAFWNEYEALACKCNGRPHWAKTYKLGKCDLQKLYPKFVDFANLRSQLDPLNLFVNRNLANIFGIE